MSLLGNQTILPFAAGGISDEYRTTGVAPGGYPIIDGFEDGSLSEYTGDLANFSAQSTTVYDGSFALQFTGTTSYQQIISKTGLDNYPQQGQEAVIFLRFSSKSDVEQVRWDPFYLDANNSIYTGLRLYTSSNIRLQTNVNTGGSTVTKETGDISGSLSTGTWYKLVTQWDDGSTFGQAAGDVRCQLRQTDDTVIATTTWGNETTYSVPNGIRIQGNLAVAGASMYLDHAYLRNP